MKLDSWLSGPGGEEVGNNCLVGMGMGFPFGVMTVF